MVAPDIPFSSRSVSVPLMLTLSPTKLGEAVKRMPNWVRNRYPRIPWKDVAGMRDKLIHECSGVDVKRVWKTVEEDILNLKPLFEKSLCSVALCYLGDFAGLWEAVVRLAV
jgi:hypothetical protein